MTNVLEIILIILLSVASSDMAFAGSPVITKQASFGNNKGTLRVEAHLVSPLIDDYDTDNFTAAEYKIKIFRNNQASPVQELDTYATISFAEIDLMDLNGDDYIDILFYNTRLAGPTIGADVFIYDPKIEKFVMCQTLSESGVISKGSKKNCVEVKYKSSRMGYTTETWCFIKSKGSWKMTSSKSTDPDDE